MSAAAPVPGDGAEVLISVRGLRKYFPVLEGFLIKRVVAEVKAVDDVSFDIRRGETLGLVGESGCGKTTIGRCLLRLEKPTAGSIEYQGEDLAAMSDEGLKALRRKIQVIFQDPFSSLNPRMKIGQILGEPMRVHRLYATAGERKDRWTSCSGCAA